MGMGNGGSMGFCEQNFTFPGEVLLDRGGKDATEDYEDVGHSNEARKTLNKYEIGELPPSEKTAVSESGGSGSGGSGLAMAVPILAIAVGLGYYFFMMEQ